MRKFILRQVFHLSCIILNSLASKGCPPFCIIVFMLDHYAAWLDHHVAWRCTISSVLIVQHLDCKMLQQVPSCPFCLRQFAPFLRIILIHVHRCDVPPAKLCMTGHHVASFRIMSDHSTPCCSILYHSCCLSFHARNESQCMRSIMS